MQYENIANCTFKNGVTITKGLSFAQAFIMLFQSI